MSQTITAVFDGHVLRPEAPVDLEPNQRYRLTIEPATSGDSAEDAWDILERLTSTIDAPSDWSAEHDHYLYGTPKRQQSTCVVMQRHNLTDAVTTDEHFVQAGFRALLREE